MIRLILTPGDPDGIGPEVTLKALRSIWSGGKTKHSLFKNLKISVVGAWTPFKKLRANFSFAPKGALEFVAAPDFLDLAPDARAGKQAGWSIQKAVELIDSGHGDALVTGPIHKGRLQKGGYLFNGHTDFLARLSAKTGAPTPVTMMLANDLLRVALVTTHCALDQVSKKITEHTLAQAVDHTVEHLQKNLKIKSPRVAVAALNPHAGEGGIFGNEDQTVIEPALKKFRAKWGAKVKLLGPLPADTLFAVNHRAPKKLRYDAVICQYHDQGLIPVKLIDFENTVNITLGLPFIRTSVDHGVAFDIAGRGKADASSMKAALIQAVQFLK